MSWFSKKHAKMADDALVERTLAYVQAVAHEEPEDEGALLALIDGIKMTPAKSVPAIDAISKPEPLPQPALFAPLREEAIPAPMSVAIETPPAEPLPRQVLRSAFAIQQKPAPVSHAPEAKRPAPKQSDMRREIAQRVQNFKAHQQRLNDEREARIKKIYADMQTHLQRSGAQKSPPIS